MRSKKGTKHNLFKTLPLGEIAIKAQHGKLYKGNTLPGTHSCL